MQDDSALCHSIAAQPSLFLAPNTVAAFLRLFPFDVSRLGGIGRSMFDVHFYFSFFFDQTGRFGCQRLG
jgi:hypothetical protein